MSGWGAGRRTAGAARGMVLGTAMTLVVGLFAVPAFGQVQSGGVANSGGADAGTGGNSATANGSGNTATGTATGTNTGLLGGLIGVTVNLGAPQNTSSGTAAVNSGSASAAGNSSTGAVNQASGGGRHGGGLQSGSVTNSGTADANSGGNSAVGNGSTNVATTTQNVSGGLLGIGINIGGPSNTSTGTATINTGEATATGNVGEGTVSQGSGGGGHVPFGHAVGLGTGFCGLVSEQVAQVSNQGSASANTGGNEAVGNASTNTATSSGALSGGLLGLDLSLGGPTNTSDGTAQVTTGAANAAGNESTGTVVQEHCVSAARHVGVPGRAPRFVKISGHHHHSKPHALARTGSAAARLLPFAGLLLALGALALRVGPVPARRRNSSRSSRG
jgi:hypothetical protein